jgi:AraC-like DNA-binding protein
MRKRTKKSLYTFSGLTTNTCFEDYPVWALRFRNAIVNHDLHVHDFVEITLIHSGSGIHLIENSRHPLAAGCVFIVPRGIKHGYRDMHDIEMTNIVFQMKTIEKHFPQLKLMSGFFSFFLADIASKDIHKEFYSMIYPDKEHFDMLAQLSAQIRNEAEQALPGAKIMCLLSLGEIVLRLSRLYEQGYNETKETGDYQRLSQVYAYINANFKTRLSINKLARVAGMSERNFQRVFTRINGMTPTGYIMKVRLESALDKLHNSTLAISEVSLNCGFTDSSYFSSQFKKTYGISPRQYQKIVKSQG